MADSENSAQAKFDKDELKEWFTLTEVADRWAGLTGQTFTEGDLLHFGGQAMLEICASKYGYCGRVKPDEEGDTLPMWVYHYFKNHNPREPSFIHEKGFFVKEGNPEKNGEYEYEYEYDLFALKIDDIKRFQTHDEIRVAGGAIGLAFFEFGRVSFPIDEIENKTFSPTPKTIHKSDLVITKIERDRFEKERGLNQPGMTAEETPKPHEPETGTKRTKLDKQIAAILDAAKCKKYDPLKIPDGGKTEIQTIVSTDPETKSLFAKDSAFTTAWRAARNRNLVKMENHDSYAKSNR